MILPPRANTTTTTTTTSPTPSFVDPTTQLNLGLWSLFTGATILLALRLCVKLRGPHRLWHDDRLLLLAWLVLGLDDALISLEYATGYVSPAAAPWDTRMHVLINTTSCLTLVGQAWSKTAFGATLLRIATEVWLRALLWFCLVSMNAYMLAKIVLQWARVCAKSGDYQAAYRLDFCIDAGFRDQFKEGGQVYNILMDFVFALIPWTMAWKLKLPRSEKIALCATLSLGAVIAIVAAIRVHWKDDGNPRSPWYYWNNAMSNIWYSSEVAGTIMVQCIPVLRPYLRDVRRAPSSSSAWQSTRTTLCGSSAAAATAQGSSNRGSSTVHAHDSGQNQLHTHRHDDDAVERVRVPEGSIAREDSAPDHAMQASHTAAPLSAGEGAGMGKDGGGRSSSSSFMVRGFSGDESSVASEREHRVQPQDGGGDDDDDVDEENEGPMEGLFRGLLTPSNADRAIQAAAQSFSSLSSSPLSLSLSSSSKRPLPDTWPPSCSGRKESPTLPWP